MNPVMRMRFAKEGGFGVALNPSSVLPRKRRSLTRGPKVARLISDFVGLNSNEH